ncbi:alpha-mannosidase [Paenibacillus thalictri]|uniref:Alpha-mannosidase n=1 Tax=Paenibacillus thalictri TaxID=2527873 RepID=A0A4V2J3H1_9BACL|nr:alpha-mannosidase [Paenibacillus thalictri]TBL72421.1 alpha-mannosidase [Paenibacillus thalictri]
MDNGQRASDNAEGSADLVLHMIGNAHLDPVWLWRWQEGYAEIKATFRSALDRMKEFPEFVFTCAGAAYYRWVEENAPEMFAELRQRVAEGRWVIVGGWWIQPDCNLPSGESFARHALYSQRYFRERFGVMAKVGYNVDSFGHHGMLPQLLKQSGMEYYVFMRPEQHEKAMESNLFWWESKDGSRVLAYRIPLGYTTRPNDGVTEKIEALGKTMEEQGTDQMCFYGVGNHGGGPTIANLLDIRAAREKWGQEAIQLSSPNAYFERVMQKGGEHALRLPVVQDDLQHHASGCYSAHSETKASNREAEHRLLTAEKWSTMAHHMLKLPYRNERFQEAWESVMFNQFHDIMGGCSIKEAYQDARESYGHALYIAAASMNAAMQKISWSIGTMRPGIVSLTRDKDRTLWEQNDLGVPFVVFNPHSWEVTTPVQIPQQMKGVTDEAEVPQQIQRVRASRTNGGDKYDTLFLAKVPAMGYRVYWIYREQAKFEEVREAAPELSVTPTSLENRFIRLDIESHTGYIKRLADKRTGVDVLSGKGAVPVVIDEYDCDTWAHGKWSFRDELGRFADAKISVVEEGPVRGCLRVTSRYGGSVLRQDFMLHKDSADIQVKVKLDWQERHKMLKLSFPVHVEQPTATYEIPYGTIERPVNGEEEAGQQWLDISGTSPASGCKIGLALLNNGKYAFDVKDSELRMTVARGAIFADHYGQRDELCEFMDQGVQEFAYALVPHEGSWQDAGVVRKAYELGVPLSYVIETYHEGNLPQRYCGIRIESEHVVATAFKKAEEADGYILRCYETDGRPAAGAIEVPMLGRKWTAAFGPCEIKTFLIPYDPKLDIAETNLLEL